jgi:hypothetical protein
MAPDPTWWLRLVGTRDGIPTRCALLSPGVSAPALPLSLLDFVDIPAGVPAPSAVERTVRTAQAADRLGYSRFWISEHHSFTGLGSSSPEILIAHIAGATNGIRVGAAGIMLPNHSPLKVAEWFKTLRCSTPGGSTSASGGRPAPTS